ncbi:hypothetical protein GE107_09325 [Cohnella sp. CFH 77786]|nr:hypothetical protein [Cohnella sp. CFH 77786]
MNKMKGATENLDFLKEINADQSDPSLKYLDSEEVGYDGIELMYQKEMRGLNGYKSYQIDSSKRLQEGSNGIKFIQFCLGNIHCGLTGHAQ